MNTRMTIAGAALPLITLCAVTLSAQQTATQHARTGQVRRHVASPCPDPNSLPPLPPGIPPAAGKAQTAFALRYIDVQTGTGAVAGPFQFYTVHYTGWLASDGTKFDSSLDRNEPITFQQGTHRVIPGWDEGFEGMRVGGKRRLFVPYQLAYGQLGRPPVIPSKADLIFDVELLAASDNPPAPPASEDHPATQPGADSGASSSPQSQPQSNPTPPPIQPAQNDSTAPPSH